MPCQDPNCDVCKNLRTGKELVEEFMASTQDDYDQAKEANK